MGTFRDVWQRVGFYRDAGNPFSGNAIYGRVSFSCLALAELFGLLDVARGAPAEKENWPIVGVRATEFGEALVATLDLQPLDVQLGLGRRDDEPDFGAWQPWFQECFPEWRNNLAFPEPEPRDGVFVFKAKWGSVWRRIAIPADCDLEALAWAIIREFKFDGDHLYDFTFPDRDGSVLRVDCPHIEDGEAWTDEYAIGRLPLAEGQSMVFNYDYGARLAFRREAGGGDAAQSAAEKATAGGIAREAAQGVWRLG